MALDEIRRSQELPAYKNDKRLKAEICSGKIGKEKIILAKPQTYMNNSGQSVSALLQNHKIGIEDLIVIQDDVDLPLL